MPSVVVLNQSGAEVGKLRLSKEVFSYEPNMQVVYDVVNAERAAMRQGTHQTKERSEVRGGGRKPWRQKGTGRARQGSIRAPQWRGGGIVFGPKPRSYSVKVNKKVVKVAVKSLLSDRLKNNKIVVVDQFALEDFKTKTLVSILSNLKAEGKVLVITNEDNYNLFTAGRNIPGVYVQTKAHLSVYDLISANMYIMTQSAAKKYEEDLK
ncbi:MAG TPA: 50S ribosomal protein L4 [Bacilli bacterium]|jgi:large subunit ribosomal protein L4|nr:50S ribosomal protein L4 [Acholeplasmataceae bacterium]HNZ77429.1 50S ribosomal protein L4 [Bacilli bacterium]HOD61584.1 50S ribosomal protein L4 [Bacilli bacterium]HOH61634.1 50S ribosomal protein L4 [Bacilli bacterium]HPB48838.1 50S ribosomal protein L4 [Bacilli bacterium]